MGYPMPRPLPQTSKITDGKGWPLERRPELACCIGRVAAIWSRIEERLSSIINHLLGAEPRRGMTMFQALSGTADKVAVLRALGNEYLSKDQQSRLNELIDRFSSCKSARDRIIRGHWYVSDDHPDALVWADPSDELVGASEFWSGFQSSGGFQQQVKFARDYARPRPNYLLFERGDFDETIEDLRTLGFALTDFLIDLSQPQAQSASAEG